MPALSHLCDDTRDDWGAAPSRGVNFATIGEKDNFLTHHDGASRLYLADKSHDACLARVRAVQRFHMGPSRGWDDIGYNTLLCPHGRLIEGRGVLAVGAQCPGYNRSGVGSQLMVGGADPLPPIMLNRQRKFYDGLVALRGGATMRKMGHRDGVATECPGDELYKWVRAGMPIIGGTGGHTAPIPAPKPQPAPRPKPSTSTGSLTVKNIDLRDVSPNVTGPGVKPMQRLLGVKADGYGGPTTRAALGAAQKRAGLRVDYIFGSHTAEALLAGK